MTALRVAELDFDTIKTNLKDFLRGKPEFTDYDFEGSGLSVLVDLLAYNTHYNAVIANMGLQEIYLDTAVKPASMALIAKRVGYTPLSYKAPRATLQVEVFPAGNPNTLTLGKGAQFTATIDSSNSATFVTRDAYTISKVGGRYVFSGVQVFEGSIANFKYVVDTNLLQRFEIPSSVVDTNLIRVTVQDDLSSTNIVEYTKFDSILDVSANTLAYFVKLNENLNYEIYFGDGIFGKAIQNGNVINIEYIETNGPAANGASKFTFNDSINGYSNIVVTTTDAAYGGSTAEGIESVRTNAQNALLMQNRAITEADYAGLIAKFLPVESVSIWGGETLAQPIYGKVFISVKQPNTTNNLTTIEKNYLLSQIKSRTALGLVHEFVDPEYIYITIDSDIKYDSRKTTLGQSTLITIIKNALIAWGTNNLNTFNSAFEYSKLVAYIDDIDRSIIANDTDIKFTKSLTSWYNVNKDYTFNFYCGIKASNSLDTNITSTPFRSTDDVTKDVYLADDNGVLYTYYVQNSERIILNPNVGTVDYNNGIVSLSATLVSGGAYNTVSVTVVPDNKNTIQSRNNIITLNASDINLTLRPI